MLSFSPLLGLVLVPLCFGSPVPQPATAGVIKFDVRTIEKKSASLRARQDLVTTTTPDSGISYVIDCESSKHNSAFSVDFSLSYSWQPEC